MRLLEYLMSLNIGEVNVEEDHKIKMVIVRTSRALTPEQQEACERLVYGIGGVRFVVVGPR